MSARNGQRKKDHWVRDIVWHFGTQRPFLLVLIAVIAIFAGMLLPALSKAKQYAEKRSVVVYAAQDQVYAEPILCEFEKETGLKVKAVYDSEAVKTVGLANRLLAERSHPQCDVFWGNEEMRTRQLDAQGVFRQTNGWAAFGYRSRRIVINTNFVRPTAREIPSPGLRPPSPRPTGRGQGEGNAASIIAATSLLELTNAQWRGRVALAFPQFGTTATHFHALRQLWGEDAWLAWCRALAANQPFVVDGNSVVVKFVGRGEAWIGLTDSDDIAAGQREGLPIAAPPFTPALSPSDGERVSVGPAPGETLLIPNTVAVIRNAPHPENAQKLSEYLQRREVAEKLVQAGALEGATYGANGAFMKLNWDLLLRDLETTTKQLNEVFLR